MKNVFLKSLTLYFFKGTKKRSISFENHETDITGPNGSGKTTIFDAFTWLLFNKDSHDRKDFNIKTLDENNQNVEKIEHTVEGVLSVDGSNIVLKRIFKENWVKRKGALEPELKGHETLFYINEVPRKAGEYATEISEIIDENIFKLITNPKYFAGLNWKNQRDILFTMAGSISDAEIASGNKVFEDLLNRLSGKKLNDYRLEISAKKKKIKDDLDAIPTRIDEAERGKPVFVNSYESVENELKAINKNIERIDNSLESASQAFSEQTEKNQEINKQINDLKTKQQQIVFDANTEAKNKDFEAKSEKREIESKISGLKSNLKSFQNLLINTEKWRNEIVVKRDTLREKYTTVFNSEFTEKEGKLTCPVFNIVCDSQKANELHKANADAARETFNKKKVEELANINKQGKEFNDELSTHDSEIESIKNDISGAERDLAGLEEQLKVFSVEKTVEEIRGEELPEWNTIQVEIAELKEKITEISAPDNTGLKAEKIQLISDADELKKVLASKEQIEKIDLRIKELNETGRNLAQQIADLEKDESTLDAFNKAMIDECESRINGRFELVKFKLFNQQLNGGESETCEMLINGVPYSDANTASQINAGLDVINVLSKFHGVTAPIFIDGRESVTQLINTESQLVNLIVTTDKELKVK